jgi:hypothetical protein
LALSFSVALYTDLQGGRQALHPGGGSSSSGCANVHLALYALGMPKGVLPRPLQRVRPEPPDALEPHQSKVAVASVKVAVRRDPAFSPTCAGGPTLPRQLALRHVLGESVSRSGSGRRGPHSGRGSAGRWKPQRLAMPSSLAELAPQGAHALSYSMGGSKTCGTGQITGAVRAR